MDKTKPNLYILMVTISLPAVGAMSITPSLSAMVHFFGISPNSTQIIMIMYLLAYASGQLIYGPMAAAIGLKNALLTGIGISAVSSFLCLLGYFFDSFVLLNIFRVFTGLGASVGLALTFSILQSCFSNDELKIAMPKVSIGLIILPFLSVTVGGLLDDFLGWQSIPVAFGLYSGLVLFLAKTLVLNDEAKTAQQSKIVFDFFRHYVGVFTSPRIVIYALMTGGALAITYIYNSVAPVLAVHVMGIKSSTYGAFGLLPMAGSLIGIFLAMFLAKRISPSNSIFIGLTILLASALVLYVSFYYGEVNPWTLFSPIPTLFTGVLLVWNNATILALQGSTDRNYSSPAMAFVYMSVGAIGVLINSLLTITDAIVLPSSLLLCVLLAAICFTITKMRKLA